LIITYDVTNQESFEAIDEFLEIIKGELANDIPKLLIGTKTDKPS